MNREEFLDAFSKAAFGRSRKESMADRKCVSCGGSAMELHSDLSKREYEISGLCQVCQDEVFNPNQDEQ